MTDDTDHPGTGTSGSAGHADPSHVVAEAMAAYDRGDLEALSRFVHPDAEIQMLALDDEVAVGPDGLRETLERMRDELHRPTMTRIEHVAADAALMIGRIQYTDRARGGLIDRPAVWLTVLRDGLLWRTHVFRTAAEARAAYLALTEESGTHQ